MADNKNQKEYTSKSGKKYIFQRVKPSQWLDILDNRDAGNGRISRKNFYTDMLAGVVVQPQLSIDDFDDSNELDEVIAEAMRFQQG